MRIVFMGAPEFAVPTLRRIVSEGHIVAAVYTRAPKPGGRRGLQIRKTPVAEAAESLGIPALTPSSLKDEEEHSLFRSHGAHVGLVVAYGLILPPAILQALKYGCLNLHASLLPRWRGAAPIQRAIMAGDAETGVCLMRMEAGLDTGPVALREVVRIRPEETAGDLTQRLAGVAAAIAVRGLAELQGGTLRFGEQSAVGVTYARKIEKDEAEIDWRRSAAQVRNLIHGLSPSPGAYSHLPFRQGLERVKVLRAEAMEATGVPGMILDSHMTVACGDGAIRVLEGQRAGRTVSQGFELMRRESLRPGATFRRSGA
ncbi:MAG TPA: methionyl-tRNA formyltransferase [Roseiarcus sp.]|nr:methionyl-tRNA formyltransferase [Roseiarcus sp.]